MVNNVETFVNIAAAADGKPVTHKWLTIAGAVRSPATLCVPIGTTYRDCLDAVGGLTTDDPVLCIGGLMMGQTTDNLDAPITKTATGVVILPRNHHVMERKLKPNKVQAKIGKSACDQCRYCTEYCPRFLLGYAVEPHQVMRSLAFTATGRGILEPVGGDVLLVRAVHPFCLPGGVVSQGSLRRFQGRDAADECEVDRADRRSSRTRCAMAGMCRSRRSPGKLNVQHYDLPAPLLDGPPRAGPAGAAAQAERRHALPAQGEGRATG